MIEKIIHPEAFMWSSELQQTIIQRCKAVQYRLQEPLSCHTSFRIGGPPRQSWRSPKPRRS